MRAWTGETELWNCYHQTYLNKLKSVHEGYTKRHNLILNKVNKLRKQIKESYFLMFFLFIAYAKKLTAQFSATSGNGKLVVLLNEIIFDLSFFVVSYSFSGFSKILLWLLSFPFLFSLIFTSTTTIALNAKVSRFTFFSKTCKLII